MTCMFRVLSIMAAMCCLQGFARANSVGTRESQCASLLRGLITTYLAQGGSLESLTLDEVMRGVDRDAADHMAQGSFADRFEIFGSNGPMDEVTKSRLIAITAYQIGDFRRVDPGRYAIWMNSDGLSYQWETEERMSALLESTGRPLVNKGMWGKPRHWLVGMLYSFLSVIGPWLGWIFLLLLLFWFMRWVRKLQE